MTTVVPGTIKFGEKIEVVHMIPGWTHNIINLSDTDDLVTVMTCNELFCPEHYQIIKTHNRIWTRNETVCFGCIFLIALLIVMVMVSRRSILRRQAVAVLLLIVFLGIVFGSTVFTRTPSVRSYKLIPFWSWKEVFVLHDRGLFIENLLNCILLMPMGILLPFIADRKIRWRQGFLAGFVVSAVIETCQLVFCLGLFEWDDMIHNGLGCMMSDGTLWKVQTAL